VPLTDWPNAVTPAAAAAAAAVAAVAVATASFRDFLSRIDKVKSLKRRCFP